MLFEAAAITAAVGYVTKVFHGIVLAVQNEARWARQEVEEKTEAVKAKVEAALKEAKTEEAKLTAEAKAKVESEAHALATEAKKIATEVAAKVEELKKKL